MSPWSTLRVAVRALTRNALRSILTVLGIVIGVGAVIAMVAAGAGAREQLKSIFDSMGTNLMMVRPGAVTTGGARSADATSTLTWGDYAAIKTEVPGAAFTAPVMSLRTQVSSEESNWSTQILGTTTEFFQIRSWNVTAGRQFIEDDENTGAKVALIGKTVATQLFGDADPIGRVIRIKTTPFEVVGLLEEKGQALGTDNDDVVYIPSRTYRSKIDGGVGAWLKGQIYVSSATPEDVPRVEARVTELLRERHHLNPGDENDFSIRNLAEIAAGRAQATATITTLLAAIAGVSLLVGGIGVMNIMLVSVVERTREIGIRMAIGARPIDVLVQFLVESIVLSAVGGAIGLGVGAFAATKLSAALGSQTSFPSETAMVAVIVSGGVGILFGLYPAVKASRLDPIQALRVET